MKLTKLGPSGGVSKSEAVTTQKPVEQTPEKLGGLVPAHLRSLPQGEGRHAQSQTSGTHVQIGAMMGQLVAFGDRALQSLQSGLLNLEADLNRLIDVAFSPQLQPVLVGVSGQAVKTRPAQEVGAKGSNIVYMSTIREMLGFGRLKNECPAEFFDKEYGDVVKQAKNGPDKAKARKAKKLAEQGKRLGGKLKGKK